MSFDRHPQIHKLMRVDPSFNDIKHQFDLWHVAKGICESLNKASVKKKKNGQAVAIDTIWYRLSTISGGALVLVIRIHNYFMMAII